MGERNRMKSTGNGKKEDKSFRSKNIKHDPAAESARAKFAIKKPEGSDSGIGPAYDGK